LLTRASQPLHHAALTALEVPLRYAQRGRSMAWAAMAGATALQPLRHYPEHDVVDRQNGVRFYYHTHPIEGGEGEHGHFHVFQERGPAFHHLAALSLDPQGRPVRWFCTNRWVTGETWPSPTDLRDSITRFKVSTRGKMAPVAAWLQALFALYADDLMALIDARDQWLSKLDPMRISVLAEDREHHVLASRPMNLHARVQQILNTTGDPP
jgi:hypothetical protein